MSDKDTRVLPFSTKKHRKSRKGCQHCKLRKVKCDEKRPTCGNCFVYFNNPGPCPYGDEDSEQPAAPTAPKRKRIRVNPVATQNALSKVNPQGIPEVVGSGLDPFDAHPRSATPETDALMQHYIQYVSLRTIPMIVAQFDQTFMKLSALDLEHRQGQLLASKTSARLKAESLTLLQTRIEDATKCYNDATISAIIVFLLVDFERGDLRSVRTHNAGLKRMVKERGGLSQIRRENRILANIIYGVSTTVMCESQFPPDEGELELILSNPEDQCPPPMITDFETYGVDPIFATLLRRFLYLVWAVEARVPFNTSIVSGQYTQQFQHLPIPQDRGPLAKYATEACKWGCAFAAFYAFVGEYPSPRLWLMRIIHRLREAMTGLLELVPSDCPLLPWLLCCGTYWTQAPERDWFLDNFVVITEDLNITTYEDFQARVARFSWVTAVCDRPCRRTWADVQAKRISLGYIEDPDDGEAESLADTNVMTYQ